MNYRNYIVFFPPKMFFLSCQGIVLLYFFFFRKKNQNCRLILSGFFFQVRSNVAFINVEFNLMNAIIQYSIQKKVLAWRCISISPPHMFFDRSLYDNSFFYDKQREYVLLHVIKLFSKFA